MSASLKDKRIGETRMQNCGLEATIVKYVNVHDIDIRFPDGKIIKHRAYTDFKKGAIKHPDVNKIYKSRKHMGETRVQNCGLEAEIIGYRNIKDIDIRFQDGIIIKHRAYTDFKKGNISHPDINKFKKIANARTNETRMQKCGLKAKIIKYRNANDIDVKFPDGKIIKHRIYQEFKKGTIQHPDISKSKKQANERIGKTYIQNCGLEAEIISYRDVKDINIQFPDGIIIEHRRYDQFMNKHIKHPTLYNSFNSNIKKIYPRSRSKIYHTQVHGIACVTNDIYYYYCHCPICLAHEIWTFDEIKNHKCNHRLVQEREKLIKARSGVPAA